MTASMKERSHTSTVNAAGAEVGFPSRAINVPSCTL